MAMGLLGPQSIPHDEQSQLQLALALSRDEQSRPRNRPADDDEDLQLAMALSQSLATDSERGSGRPSEGVHRTTRSPRAARDAGVPTQGPISWSGPITRRGAPIVGAPGPPSGASPVYYPPVVYSAAPAGPGPAPTSSLPGLQTSPRTHGASSGGMRAHGGGTSKSQGLSDHPNPLGPPPTIPKEPSRGLWPLRGAQSPGEGASTSSRPPHTTTKGAPARGPHAQPVLGQGVAGGKEGPGGPKNKRNSLLAALADECGGCHRSIWGNYTTALGAKWHLQCFKCQFCGEAIRGEYVVGDDQRPYHGDCHRHMTRPTCVVCGLYIPEDITGRVVWHETPFWKDRFCPAHSQDGTPRCHACARLQPAGQEWVTLSDGRHLCLTCLHTFVADTKDVQPLYREVLDFYDYLGMSLPVKVPLLMVDGPTLNEYANKEGGRADGPVFHVQGLCLSEVYRSVPTISSWILGQKANSVNVPVHGFSHCKVSAILVLYGLPRLLTGSILAHELMHAYLRMRGVTGVSADVEEGLCQLMAMLWLDNQDGWAKKEGEEQQRLASYLGYQIRTDTSPVYGDGFRAALEAFQTVGLLVVVESVVATGRFPSS